jgi:hypothetical protein
VIPAEKSEKSRAILDPDDLVSADQLAVSDCSFQLSVDDFYRQ